MAKNEKTPKALVVAKKPQAISPERLISQAIEKGASIETLERIMDIRKQINAENAKREFDEAMSKFQSICPIIKKTKVVMNKDKTTERYRYAPLDSIISQVRKPIADCGFSYKIEAEFIPGAVRAITKVTHCMGHTEDSKFESPIDNDEYKSAPQHVASALTFSKRYSFCDAFGIMTGDDDNDASAIDVKISEEVKKGYQKLVSQIGKMKEKQLKEFLKKVTDSSKYSKEQKEEYKKLTDARLKEISELKTIEKK
jgi:hypothetical protein